MDNIYERKSYSKEEWKEQVKNCAKLSDLYNHKIKYHSNNDTVLQSTYSEPSIPRLLLNYFVCMAYEESSVRMARELGYIKNNKDVLVFTSIYKIRERASIRDLIKKGFVSKAMEQINLIFGIEVLEGSGSQLIQQNIAGNSDKNTNGEDDLHFKLLLLHVIEMIREHHDKTKIKKDDSNEFILQLIEYTQEKLAVKAASNKSYMKELELVMTLLLFPMDKNPDIKLPDSLQNLYSLSLRSKLADLVNRKLLRHIHPEIAKYACNDTESFADLIRPSDCISGNIFSNYNEILKARPTEDINSELTTSSLPDVKIEPQGALRPKVPISESWSKTTELIKEHAQKDKGNSNNEDEVDQSSQAFDMSEFQYEAKLVQIMKLWAWCENQLHQNDIGVPRVESSI